VSNRQPTIKDVAQLAGVAVSTVSHVINQTRYVSEDTTERVESAIRQLQFRANRVARNLRSGKSHLVGFAVPNLANYFYVRIARGIEQELNRHGYHLILIDSQESTETERENVESLIDRSIDGIIMAPTSSSGLALARVRASGVPVVYVDRQPREKDVDSVLLSNTDGAYRATKYLLSAGYRTIGFIGFHYGHEDIDSTMQERIEGYRCALTDFGVPLRSELVKVTRGVAMTVNELRYVDSYGMMKELLTIPADAVLCGNGPVTVGVFSCLKDQAVRIPDELALITFDDDLWLTMAAPAISAVAQPAEMMGVAAARLLMERLNGSRKPFECIRMMPDLILRDST
jgi:LacI family transcriptional regulator